MAVMVQRRIKRPIDECVRLAEAVSDGDIGQRLNGMFGRVGEEMVEALRGILEMVIQVADIMQKIASASREQANSVTEIENSLRQIDDVTQRNTSVAQEAASASWTLPD